MAKRPKAPDATVPEWVVTYGDLMSLLLCFFILLAAFSELKKDEEYQQVVAAVKEAFGMTGGSGTAPSDIPKQNAPIQSLLEQALKGTKARPIEQAVDRSVLGRRTKVQTIHEGEMFTVGGSLAFDVGSWDLKPGLEDELHSLADYLRGRNNRIIVRGHAQGFDMPNAAGLDYRDLSYRRAKAVGEYLITECGLRPIVLSYEAMGDTEPEETRRYTPEEQEANRRVQVIRTEVVVGERHPDPDYTAIEP